MFLDDKLLEIGRNFNHNNDDEFILGIKNMMDACYENLNTGIGTNKTDATILANFSLINNIWNSVATKLINEGKECIRIDGFKSFVESQSNYKGLFFN